MSNIQDSKAISPLCTASITEGGTEVVRQLLEKGAKVNMQTMDGFSPLHIASAFKRSDTVKVLLDNSAEVNMQSGKGGSALHEACTSGDTATVKILLAKGANINLQMCNGRSALSLASSNGHTETIQVLIDKGAEIDCQDNIGRTPLMYASMQGHAVAVKVLLNKNACKTILSVTEDSATTLAIRNGHEKIVKMLISGYEHHSIGPGALEMQEGNHVLRPLPPSVSPLLQLLGQHFSGHMPPATALSSIGQNVALDALQSNLYVQTASRPAMGLVPQARQNSAETSFCDLFRALLPIQDQWENIGALLGCDLTILSSIKNSERGDLSRLREMVKELRKMDPPVSRKQVIEAVELFNPSEAKKIGHLLQ